MSLLSAALQDEMLPESEKVRIREGLKAHRDVARTMRLGMRQVIEAYANNFIINKSSPGDDTTVVALEAIHRAVERTPLFADEDINEDDDSLQGCKVWLQCQDFAGNFSMPFYGDIRPSRDYYLSNLCLYNFVCADLSRNKNFVLSYDERGQGKGGDAMCSLRLKLYLEATFNTDPKDRPDTLFVILDNCVGQNKSQV